MHYLHTLVSLIERLTKGDPVTWTLFIGFVIVLGIAFIYDLRRGKRKDSTALKRKSVEANGIPEEGVLQAQSPPQRGLSGSGDTRDRAS